LKPKEREIIQGLSSGKTVEFIAISIGISRQRANVLKLRAINKLKKNLKKKGGLV